MISGGRHHQQDRPAAEAIRLAVPGLRIVHDELWAAAQQQMESRRVKHAQGGQSFGESRYLRSGFARCAICGGGFATQSRTHRKQRAHFYACTSRWKRGDRLWQRARRSDGVDRRRGSRDLKDDILRPSVIEEAIGLVLEELKPARQKSASGRRGELADVEQECKRLAEAIGRGGLWMPSWNGWVTARDVETRSEVNWPPCARTSSWRLPWRSSDAFERSWPTGAGRSSATSKLDVRSCGRRRRAVPVYTGHR